MKGPNGNRIFLEAAGCNEGTEPTDVNVMGYYCSGTPSKTNSQASYMLMFGTESNVVNPGYRYLGASIRPVYGEEPADTTIIIDEHENDYVDLGLPSGTLWATMNVGANSPEDYGDYFAWGETTPKDVYGWSTYKWCMGSYTTMTKYCTESNYGYNGFVDNKTELDPEDDAAYVNWGPEWRMPSLEQIQELKNNCTTEWTTVNGVNGRLFTSNINGASLFLPAAGCRWYSELYDAGSSGGFWARSLVSSYPNDAYYLYFYSGNVGWNYDWYSRFVGQSVRAVRVSQN